MAQGNMATNEPTKARIDGDGKMKDDHSTNKWIRPWAENATIYAEDCLFAVGQKA